MQRDSAPLRILEAIEDAVLAVDRDRRLRYLNPVAEELFGVSLSRAGGRPIAVLGRCGEALDGLCQRALDGGGAAADVRLPGGSSARAQSGPLWEGTKADGAVVVVRTPSSSAAREVQSRGERAEMISALAAGLAHEVKNPLAGLKGAAQLLEAELPAGSPLLEYTQLIAREAERVDRLLRQMLDLSKPIELQMAPHNIHELADGVLLLARGISHEVEVRFEKRYDPSIPLVTADGERLVQVLLNLVRNAVDACAEGGHHRAEGGQPRAEGGHHRMVSPLVMVETRVAVDLRVKREGKARPMLRIAVLDNGPGLAPDVAARLFTPFVTSKARGTGLGLCIAQRIVEDHGGLLEVHNRPEGGCVAAVYLPL